MASSELLCVSINVEHLNVQKYTSVFGVTISHDRAKFPTTF